jgi:hypothetical protein
MAKPASPPPAPPKDPLDPRGLIREAYVIEGISEPECRSIFLDWAIGVPAGEDAQVHVGALLARYGADAPDHPMTKVLRDGLVPPDRTGRRGGRRGRATG